MANEIDKVSEEELLRQLLKFYQSMGINPQGMYSMPGNRMRGNGMPGNVIGGSGMPGYGVPEVQGGMPGMHGFPAAPAMRDYGPGMAGMPVLGYGSPVKGQQGSPISVSITYHITGDAAEVGNYMRNGAGESGGTKRTSA